MKNCVLAYADRLDTLRKEDFSPDANVALTLIPDAPEGAQVYGAIAQPERFVCACVRKTMVDAGFLRRFPNLKMIQIISAGFEGIDLEALRARGIQLANARGLYSGHMAEDVVMRMIYLTRKMYIAAQQQRRREWRLIGSLGALESATVVFIGAGSIASEAARRLEPFGMRVLGVARSRRAQPYFERVYAFDDIAQALPQADFVICCLPEDATTDRLVDTRVLSLVKQGAFFINVGRGRAVDEAALCEALRTGRIAAASCDVFATEPLPPDSPFWGMPNMVVTPHNSGGYCVTDGVRRREFAARNISRFLLGEPIDCRIV